MTSPSSQAFGPRARPELRRLVVSWLACLGVFGACHDASRPPHERVIARAHGTEVIEREVRAAFARREETLRAWPLTKQSKQALWTAAIDDVLLGHLVEAAAKEAHIIVLEDEVDGVLERVRPRADGVNNASSLSASEWRDAARAHLLIGKYVAYQVAAKVQVSEDDLERYADEHPEILLRPQMIRLRFLRLPSAAHVTQLKQKVARGKGPADAASEALGKTVDVGDLGLVALDQLPSEVRVRTEKLALRKLSEPLPLGEEVAVFWVSERTPVIRDAIVTARRRIERRLRREREAAIEQQVLTGLKHAAHAEVLYADMPSDI